MNLSILLWLLAIILTGELIIYLKKKYYNSEQIRRNFSDYLPYVTIVYKNPFEGVIKDIEVRDTERRGGISRGIRIPERGVIIMKRSLDNFIASSLLLRILGRETPVKIANDWNFNRIIESYYFSSEKELSLILLDFPFSKTIAPGLGELVRSYLREKGEIYWFDRRAYDKNNPILKMEKFHLIEVYGELTISETVRRNFNFNDPYSEEIMKMLDKDVEDKRLFSYRILFQELIEQSYSEELINIYLNRLAFGERINKIGLYRSAKKKYEYTEELLREGSPMILTTEKGRRFGILDLRKIRMERMNSYKVVVLTNLEPYKYFYEEALNKWDLDMIMVVKAVDKVEMKFREDLTIKKEFLFGRISKLMDVEIRRNYSLGTYEIKFNIKRIKRVRGIFNLSISNNRQISEIKKIVIENLI